MSDAFASGSRAIEARAIEDHDRDFDPSSHVPYSERIKTRSKEPPKFPFYLKSITDSTLYSDFVEIVDQIWVLNEEHVGERTREAEVYLCLTGKDRPLRDRLSGWCRKFIAQRLARQNPKDRNDHFLQFERLTCEIRDIFSIFGTPGTIDYVISYECSYLLRWLIFEGTFKNSLVISPNEESIRLTIRPIDMLLAKRCIASVKDLIFNASGLKSFLGMVEDCVDQDKICEIRLRPSDPLAKLEWLAAGIQEMRPFLVRNFNPAKTLIEIGPGFTVAWDWTLVGGMANLIGGDSKASALESLATHRTRWTAVVGYDGLLCDQLMPWVRTGTSGCLDGRSGLLENLYILEMFHDKLLEFYNKIDFERIRSQAEERACQSAEAMALSDDTEEVFALSYQQLALTTDSQDAETGVSQSSGRQIKILRMDTLKRFLEKHFNCEVSQGKGSEVKIHRPGVKQFVLGCHGKNPQVHSFVVRRLLRTLCITEEEWLRAVCS